MAENNKRKDEQNEQRVENQKQSNRNQSGEQGEDIGANEVGRTNNLPEEEVERQEQWRENPDSREFYGPKTVPADEVSPKNS